MPVVVIADQELLKLVLVKQFDSFTDRIVSLSIYEFYWFYFQIAALLTWVFVLKTKIKTKIAISACAHKALVYIYIIKAW